MGNQNTLLHKENLNMALEFYKQTDPTIYQIMQNIDFTKWFEPWKEFRGNDLFISLCRSIVGQQLSVKVANVIFKRFNDLFNENGLTPTAVIAKTDEELRGVGLSKSKVIYIKDLANKIISNEIDLDGLNNLEDATVIDELVKVKGIGKWTAEMFLLFTLSRPNIFSYGDLGLRKGFEKVYEIPNASEKEILNIIEKWHPYKTYGSITLWHSLGF